MKKALLALAAVPFLFLFFWMAFPAASIQSIIEDSLSDSTITGEVRGLKKGLFYTITVESVALKNSGEELVAFENIRSRINPFGLIRMRLDVSVSGGTGSGTILGNAILSRTRLQAKLDFQGVEMKEMQFLRRTGIHGAGTISGRLLLTGDKGQAEFATSNAVFEPADFSGIKVPMNFFDRVTGSLSIEGSAIEVTSITLNGNDIYARLKGLIRNGGADLTMELMPGGSFLENPLFSIQLDRYKVSPGYYVIPVNGKFTL